MKLMGQITNHNRAMEPGPAEGNRWLTTFNDMITLLMVFFVMLFAMGSLDIDRFHNFQNALQSAMGVLNAGSQSPEGILADNQNEPMKSDGSEVKTQDEPTELNQLENTSGLEAEYTKKGIQLILNDELMFDSGSARLTQQGIVLLKKVARIIGPLNRFIRVEGHTDNIPISTGRYPSNWELSTARAVHVVKFLQIQGNISARNLSAAGYGASRPRAKNDSEVGRSKNRRVEIILKQEAQSQFVQ